MKPTTKLINLPTRLSKLETEVLTIRTEIKKLQQSRDKLMQPIERQVAFELAQTCKNKEQRDVARADMIQENEALQGVLKAIEEQELAAAKKEIELRQLERIFSVEKLMAKWALAFQYSTISQMFDLDDGVEIIASNGNGNGSDRI
jgi:SMC interacting uncharacterized protein involved in chromosome segregation